MLRCSDAPLANCQARRPRNISVDCCAFLADIDAAVGSFQNPCRLSSAWIKLLDAMSRVGKAAR